ncbi:hypothetical protein P691DRAFT_790845 [Macrolepiota fuliginosa MF-IS2]|uniref:Uncharacterized protein n=1 Tax=Macrolepiota fuliginosa MF-IS2 TaxID=1400762 RepID=A0A9P5X1I8_9AGAR|nr:hypothetical protein P691DRAFT_790845 [Macrolepiota fuliginosa MF-IS2]
MQVSGCHPQPPSLNSADTPSHTLSQQLVNARTIQSDVIHEDNYFVLPERFSSGVVPLIRYFFRPVGTGYVVGGLEAQEGGSWDYTLLNINGTPLTFDPHNGRLESKQEAIPGFGLTIIDWIEVEAKNEVVLYGYETCLVMKNADDPAQRGLRMTLSGINALLIFPTNVYGAGRFCFERVGNNGYTASIGGGRAVEIGGKPFAA